MSLVTVRQQSHAHIDNRDAAAVARCVAITFLSLRPQHFGRANEHALAALLNPQGWLDVEQLET